MKPVLFNLADTDTLSRQLSCEFHLQPGEIETRQFPDGELYQCVMTEVRDRKAVVIANLFHPDPQLFSLLSLGHNLKELGAKQICLITPYLPYMRQDKRFRAGESVTSRHFARHLSLAFDHLITVDPHLHRYHSLSEIYTLNSRVVSARTEISRFLKALDKKLILIGPDEESEQWVRAIGELAGLPFQILRKERSGDYQVEISSPSLAPYKDHQPVLIDDIISSGRTMLKTLEQLRDAGMSRPLIIGVHGLFAGDAYQLLSREAEVVTSNSIPHPSNQIDLTPALQPALAEFLDG